MKASASAALLAASMIVLGPGPAPITGGVASAKEFFTRKRVNGRWVAGKFAKPEATKARAKAGRGRRRLASRAAPEPVEADPRPMPPTRPAGMGSRASDGAPSSRVIATASITPAPAEARMERMRSALEARAKTLASEALPVAEGAPVASPPVGIALRSVTFDFQKGLKTVVFDDNVAVTEPLDPNHARELAAAASPRR